MHRLPVARRLTAATVCVGVDGRGVHALVVAMARPWRPNADDVDRLSRGDAAKRRGTGNYNIPHRLSSDERPPYDAAKKRGWLAVRGTGYRKGRKGHPLPNVYRQWCDAKARACVLIEQDATGGGSDTVVVDLAPLRRLDLAAAIAACDELAAVAGATRVPPSARPLDVVPFNTLPVDLPFTVHQLLHPDEAAAAAGASAGLPPAPTPEQIQGAEAAVQRQADLVRQLKAAGQQNSSPDVQQHVQELLRLKAELQALLDAAAAAEAPAGSPPQAAPNAVSSSSGGADAEPSGEAADGHEGDGAEADGGGGGGRREAALSEDHPFARAAIWQLPVIPLFYEAERSAAKSLAASLAEALAGAGGRAAAGHSRR